MYVKWRDASHGDPLAQGLARRIVRKREVSGSNPASHSEKCHRGAMGRGPVLTNFTSSTEMRHPPALSLPKFGHNGISKLKSLGI